MAARTQALTEFLLARIAEDDRRDRDGWLFRDCESERERQALRGTTAYAFSEARIALRRIAFAYRCLIPGEAQRLALKYADHPDFREEWRPDSR